MFAAASTLQQTNATSLNRAARWRRAPFPNLAISLNGCTAVLQCSLVFVVAQLRATHVALDARARCHSGPTAHRAAPSGPACGSSERPRPARWHMARTRLSSRIRRLGTPATPSSIACAVSLSCPRSGRAPR
eukprot:547444-Pyramimonas_sp.AAC.1